MQQRGEVAGLPVACGDRRPGVLDQAPGSAGRPRRVAEQPVTDGPARDQVFNDRQKVVVHLDVDALPLPRGLGLHGAAPTNPSSQLRDPFGPLDKQRPDTVIVLPSMTMDHAGLAKIPGVRYYEERLLVLLQVCRTGMRGAG